MAYGPNIRDLRRGGDPRAEIVEGLSEHAVDRDRSDDPLCAQCGGSEATCMCDHDHGSFDEWLREQERIAEGNDDDKHGGYVDPYYEDWDYYDPYDDVFSRYN